MWGPCCDFYLVTNADLTRVEISGTDARDNREKIETKSNLSYSKKNNNIKQVTTKSKMVFKFIGS